MAKRGDKDGGGPGAFGIVYGVVKTVAILFGGAVTIPSLMSLVGLATDNGWIRLAVAVVVAVGIPLFIADRLLPEDDPGKGKGLPTDVFAAGWLGFALLFVGVAGPWTGALLWQESERIEGAGMPSLAAGVRWVAGPAPSDDGDAAGAVEGEPAKDTGAAAEADGGAASGDAKGEDGGGGPAPPGGDGGAADAAAVGGDDGATMTAAEIFRKWAPSVVSVQIGRGGGTGFVIDDDGTIATNHHVVKAGAKVQVKLYDGSWADEVWLLDHDEDKDLALLRAETDSELAPVVLGDSDDVQVGEGAIAIGNPLGLEHTLTDGIVSARRVWQGRKMIQMSTPVSPGNSGGPLFDAHGEVIGVNTATVGPFGMGQNLNLAVPINTLKEMLEDDYPDAKRVGGGGGSAQGRW